jgi:hypothetical protein
MPCRWLVVAAPAVPAVAGCDSGGGARSGSTSASSPRTSTTSQSVFESHPILLTSEAGTQEAALMPCVRFTTAENDWPPVCRDGMPALQPSSLSVVRPGETITISFPGAQVENPSGCREICGATFVQPLGCKDRQLGNFQLLDGDSTEWRVDLPPGRYELDVYADLRTDEGFKVFTTGDFGLVVDDALSPRIRPVDLPPCS